MVYNILNIEKTFQGTVDHTKIDKDIFQKFSAALVGLLIGDWDLNLGLGIEIGDWGLRIGD